MYYLIIIILLLSLFLILKIIGIEKSFIQTILLPIKNQTIDNTPVITNKLFLKPLVLIPIISIRDNFYEKQIGLSILSKTNKYNVFLIHLQILKPFIDLMTNEQQKKIEKIIINTKSPYFNANKQLISNKIKEINITNKILVLNTTSPLCSDIVLSNLNIFPCELRRNSVLNKQTIKLITKSSNNSQGLFKIIKI